MTDEATVTKNPEQNRYEIHSGATLVGFAEYLHSEGLITFTHTEVDDAFEGQGMGSKLIRGALDAVREDGGRKVLPVCPFVKAWMQKHPEYLDLHYGN